MSESPKLEQGGSGQLSNTIPTWFWVVSVIALLWNLMGLSFFVLQMVTAPEDLSTVPAEQELYKLIPLWATVAFAAAVIFGVLGSVGLLMRGKWAYPVFILSVLGVVGQQTHMFLLSDTMKIMGGAAAVLPTLVLVIAIALVVFSKASIGKGWLR